MHQNLKLGATSAIAAVVLAGIATGALERHVGLLTSIALLLAAAAAVLVLRLERAGRRHRVELADLRAAKRTAEEEARRKSELLAQMSHEIRSPMSGIIASAEMLLHTDLTAEQRRHAETIGASAEASLRLIGDVLDFSRIENGKLALEEVAFSPRNVVRGVIDVLAARAQRQGLDLRSAIDRRLPLWVRGDPSRLRQVLVNLTDNAIKFTREGRVEVTAEPFDSRAGRQWIRFAVRDTGIGLTADEQARIFEPYQQADASTARHYGGTGLGLSICRDLVELMGGRIGVESEPGTGSSFWFEVPFAIAQAEGGGTATEAAPETGLHDPERRDFRLLVAEDNPVNQEVARRLLQTLGYRADVVGSGLEVLEALDRRRYDLVLMDCQMPELDGYATAREIRRREGAASRLPIVAVTAHALPGDREACLAAGMDEYVTKPLRSLELAGVIDRRLGRSAASPEATPRVDAAANPAVEALAPVLDPNRLAELARLDGNSGRWLISVIEDYARQTPRRVDKARAALAAGDAEAALQAFHVLAGSSANVGATHLAVASRRLEDFIRAGDLAACRGRLGDLEGEWRHLSEQLEGVVALKRPAALAGVPG